MSSNRIGLAVDTTASFPNPAQDYYTGPASLDKNLIEHPTATYILRATSDALASLGIHAGDEVIVDRSLDPAPGRVLVVVHEDEHRLGVFQIIDGRAVLVTDDEEVPLTADVQPWGVAVYGIRHLPLGQRRTTLPGQ